ncbi:hypothetical protein J6590_005608 [Homalodisca vitripennis]|nr:hypothetical protein J6590_005608 [Homalodisca vitripennis]
MLKGTTHELAPRQTGVKARECPVVCPVPTMAVRPTAERGMPENLSRLLLSPLHQTMTSLISIIGQRRVPPKTQKELCARDAQFRTVMIVHNEYLSQRLVTSIRPQQADHRSDRNSTYHQSANDTTKYAYGVILCHRTGKRYHEFGCQVRITRATICDTR